MSATIKPAALVLALASAMAGFAAHATDITVPTGTTDTTRYTLKGSDTLSIENGGTLNTAKTTITLDASKPATGLQVTNSGSLISGNRGIDTDGSGGTPFNLTVTNNAGGVINTTDDSIRINTDIPATSKVVIENSGTITSAVGQAIDFDAIDTAGSVTINNRAGGVIQAMDADAVRPGEGGVVNNWGTITSFAPANTSGDPDDDPTNDGIDMQGHSASVHNYAGGVISGARHGITSDVNVDVINDAGGTIIGRNGSGVGSDGNGKVVNYGTITGAIDTTSVNGDGDGDGVDIDGNADITNYGTIQGIGAKGSKDGSANNSEGIAAGGGAIRNLGVHSVISGLANGILIDDSAEGPAPFATNLVNEGTIRGVTGFGVKLTGNQNDTVTNSGLIAGGNGLALDMGGGDDTLNVLTGGAFIGRVDGGAGNDTVNLIGTGTFAGAGNFENMTVSGGTWTLTGNQTYANGVGVGADGGLNVQGTLNTTKTAITLGGTTDPTNIQVTNSGTIVSGNRGIDTAKKIGSPFNFTLVNSGGAVIDANDDGVRINSDIPVGKIVVDNSGTITSKVGQAIDFDAITTAGNVTINNRAGGLIQAMDADAVRPGEGGVVNNWGTIISFAPANTSGDPDDDPSNDGVDMQGHSAVVHNYAGGLISGARHGITSDVDVDVTNEAGGTIIGRNGSGVGSDGNGKVLNYGTITGAIDTTSVNGDGDGVDIDFKADITNYGTIQGIGAKGSKDGSANNSEGIAAGGGSIRNLGAQSVISGQANGILIDDSAEGPAPFATTLVNEGTIRGVTGFGVKLTGNQNDTVTNSGLIAGGNGLALDMGGGDDTLNVVNGGRFTGLVDGGAGNDTINLIGTGTFAGGVNFENLTVSGGAWVLTGNQNYANGVTLGAGGSLDVQGTLGGTLTVGPNGLLDGNGTLGSAIIAGTVAPGHSIGHLTFTGNYTQLAGSTYHVEVANGGQSDQITVAGAAAVAGQVLVTPMAGTLLTPGLRYTILSAGQGVTGTYDSANTATQLLFLQPALSYDPDHVYLQFDRNAAKFADFAQTKNQRAAANGADSQPDGQIVHDTIAVMSDPDAARAAYDSVSGEIHASLKSALLEDSHFTRDAINDRLHAAFDNGGRSGATGAAPDRGAMWAQAYGAWGGFNGNGNASHMDRTIGGFIVGADFPVAGTWRAGVAAGYDRTTLDVDGRDSSADVDSYTLGAYAGTQIGALGLRFGAANTWHNIDTHRNVGFAGFAGETEKASYDGNTAQVFGEAGYKLQYGAASFEPFAGLAYANLHTQGFDEDGSAAGLSGRSSNTDVTFSTLGLRASMNFDTAGKTATLNGMVGWRHAFGDTTPTATQALPGGSNFSVAGVPVAVDAAVMQAGMDLNVTDRVKVGLSYQGQFGDGVHQNGLVANVNVRF